jgi:hypothetical protein
MAKANWGKRRCQRFLQARGTDATYDPDHRAYDETAAIEALILTLNRAKQDEEVVEALQCADARVREHLLRTCPRRNFATTAEWVEGLRSEIFKRFLFPLMRLGPPPDEVLMHRSAAFLTDEVIAQQLKKPRQSSMQSSIGLWIGCCESSKRSGSCRFARCANFIALPSRKKGNRLRFQQRKTSMVERVRLIKQDEDEDQDRAKPGPSIRCAIRNAINPRDAIEELYVDELADAARLQAKLRDLGLRPISTALPDALYELLSDELDGLDPSERVNLVDAWSRGDPMARSEIAALLQRRGLTEEDVSAHALLSVLPTVSAVESFRSLVSSRRDKALAGIAFRRQMVSQEQQLQRSLTLPRPRGKHGD